MKIRADENVSYRIVKTVNLLCLREGWEFSHVRDVHAARTSDETWLPQFAAEGGKAILSGDANMLKRPHQIGAVRETGLVCFVLSKAWTQARRHEQAANILFWWPRIELALEQSKPGDCWPVPNKFDASMLVRKVIDYDKAKRALR